MSLSSLLEQTSNNSSCFLEQEPDLDGAETADMTLATQDSLKHATCQKSQRAVGASSSSSKRGGGTKKSSSSAKKKPAANEEPRGGRRSRTISMNE
mmetsp:Transcript_31920/g.66621  ORF Transcript_31920/g.66621 Transcript_31920/m.66621 type:complete len:96 (+) Transcript_31920:173-460(+)|eukprot:CAMPEP_0172440004 /NCGR_PEP_ID=MMETSP1065-20121228/813_1 /TAXON_ID=265537 /ORGANISM="Amphiprora paludosa, Strain CCMP125" /LENGTH=95 /DNA_ID=CAMNT_0013188781 /DNA_START=172 /DNA_END=459 /DNA_ORIENTATION=-